MDADNHRLRWPFPAATCGQSTAPGVSGSQRLDVHRPEQIDPHHLRDAARIIAVGRVDGFRCRLQVVWLPPDPSTTIVIRDQLQARSGPGSRRDSSTPQQDRPDGSQPPSLGKFGLPSSTMQTVVSFTETSMLRSNERMQGQNARFSWLSPRFGCVLTGISPIGQILSVRWRLFVSFGHEPFSNP
jgi:hypothetical protein